jgi:hypothetical protein
MGDNKTINSEQAFDMLPYVVDIYDKLDIDGYRKQLTEKYRGKKVDQKELGIQSFKYIFKNSQKVKKEFFNIVAIAEKRDLEAVKKESIVKTILTIKAIFSDPELVDFFKQAMQ